MKGVKSHITHGLQKGSYIPTCDNSGAKVLRVISFKGGKTVKGRNLSGGVGMMITASVSKGTLDMRKKVVSAVIVRQKKSYRRPDGSHITFEDNAAVVLKDVKGQPKGTIIKGAIAKEVAERWPHISKIARIMV